jgi:MoaA/NifB/PqqE/SkfB family radical SAM enzyme
MSPGDFLAGGLRDSYTIIAATLYDEEIAAALESAGLTDQADFCRVSDLRSFKYSIEVSGRCNLRCPSCPRGNFSPQPESGLMSLETYEKILDKILAEDPLVWEIELYRWGEPLLNPLLPQMVRLGRQKGVGAVISTNLNVSRGLEELIKAGPRQIIVSASGYGDSYEKTHSGGRWPVFVKNLRDLVRWRKLHSQETEIELYYHIYKDRRGDFLKMRDLCQELGLPLRPTWACLLPLDHLHRLANGQPLSPAAAAAVALQPLPATELTETVKNQALRPCGLQNLLAITPELEVPACSCWFDPEIEPLTRDFLQTPLAELIAARRASGLCRLCKKERLHHYYLIWHEKGEMDALR